MPGTRARRAPRGRALRSQRHASAVTPKTRSTSPETRLTQRRAARFKRDRTAPTTPLRRSHQSAEPRKTPPTRRAASRQLPAPAMPKPTKTATKERIVAGFASVSSNVSTNAPRRPAPPGARGVVGGVGQKGAHAQVAKEQAPDQA